MITIYESKLMKYAFLHYILTESELNLLNIFYILNSDCRNYWLGTYRKTSLSERYLIDFGDYRESIQEMSVFTVMGRFSTHAKYLKNLAFAGDIFLFSKTSQGNEYVKCEGKLMN